MSTSTLVSRVVLFWVLSSWDLKSSESMIWISKNVSSLLIRWMDFQKELWHPLVQDCCRINTAVPTYGTRLHLVRVNMWMHSLTGLIPIYQLPLITTFHVKSHLTRSLLNNSKLTISFLETSGKWIRISSAVCTSRDTSSYHGNICHYKQIIYENVKWMTSKNKPI